MRTLGLVEVYVSRKKGGKERTRYLDYSLYVHGSLRLNFPLEKILELGLPHGIVTCTS